MNIWMTTLACAIAFVCGGTAMFLWFAYDLARKDSPLIDDEISNVEFAPADLYGIPKRGKVFPFPRAVEGKR